MKEKGFTLVEVIAIIVLLAIIAVITTPQVIKTINDSKKKAFKTSAEGLMESASQAHTEMLYERQIKEVIEFNLTTGQNVDKLETSGSGPTDGYIRISPKGLTEVAVRNDKYCAVKNYNEGKVSVFSIKNKICNTGMGGNLVTNGYGELADNTNFNQFQYHADATAPYYTYTSNGYSNLYTSEYIPIDPKKKYKIQLDMKSSNTNATYYVGVMEHDIDKNPISPSHTMYIENTLTTLAADLNDGDTTVSLSDLTNWNVTTSTLTYLRGFTFWNYKDSTGNLYPELTYSRNTWYNLYTDANVNKSTNTITLTSPWNHGSIAAGTKVSQSHSGETYNYGILSSKPLTTEWKTYSNTMTGEAFPSDKKFRYGTKYIRLVILHNYNYTANTTTSIRNISIKEVE